MTTVERRPARFWEFLDRGLFRDLGIPTLVVSLVLFVSAMTLLGANVSELRAGYGRVQQTNGALLQLAMINTDILRVEMIVRGYALSGDPIYLTWQKMAEKGIQTRLAALDKAVGDDPDQRADMVTLRKLLADHVAHFEALAQLVPSNRDRVVADIVTYGKKVKRLPIERLLVDLRDDQMRRLAEQQQEAETRVVNAYRDAIAISSIALILGAIGFSLIIHDRRTRRQR